MTAVISVHLRTLIKVGEFLCCLLKVEEKSNIFCHIRFYYLKKGKNATETQEKICAMYGEGAVTDQVYQNGL